MLPPIFLTARRPWPKVMLLMGFLAVGVVFVPGKGAAAPLSLKDTVAAALEANLGLQIAKREIEAADAQKNVARAGFLPTFSAAYQWEHRDREQGLDYLIPGVAMGDNVVVRPQDEITFIGSVRQPLFSGFGILNQYRAAQLGLDIATLNEQLTRLEVIFRAKEAYFNLLRTIKQREVAAQTVVEIEAQKEVAQNFYEVGMSPLNDLLQAQVELANARQSLEVAHNDLEIARARLNTLLRQPVNTPVAVETIEAYAPMDCTLEECLARAMGQRLDIRVAELEVQLAEKETQLARKDFFPSVNLTYNYYQRGEDYRARGGDDIGDTYSWEVIAAAQWNVFEWGRTTYGVREKLSRLSQARSRQSETADNVTLEVQEAFLRARQAQTNIVTVEKAVEQARENFRINQERYREQVATNTDVLNAQTLLARTVSSYYNALYGYKIAQAFLQKAMSLEVLE
jgi:outer membrane protein